MKLRDVVHITADAHWYIDTSRSQRLERFQDAQPWLALRNTDEVKDPHSEIVLLLFVSPDQKV